MHFDKKQFRPYLEWKSDLIPLRKWDSKKVKKDKEIPGGKLPLHMDWTTKKYAKDAYKYWLEQGLNIGYRIPEDEIIIDMDPRNYKGERVEEDLAELFGYLDFEDLLENQCVVKTGGGGYHIYCELPFYVSFREIRETIDLLPGIEFKRRGRQVACAGSKHPNGNFYIWANRTDKKEIPDDLLCLIKRDAKSRENASSEGFLTGLQLEQYVLSKLDVTDYDDNDSWFPIMCACHHATNGEGVEEFIEWSISDKNYEDDEGIIRSRWDSLYNEKEYIYSIGTLIYELESIGEDTANVKAIFTFSNINNLKTDEDSEEEDIVNFARQVAHEIELPELFDDPEIISTENGAAINAVDNLNQESSEKEIMRCLRLINSADVYESALAHEKLCKNTGLSKSVTNKMLKGIEQQLNDDLGVILSRKTLELVFNEGRHLTTSPNGMIYAYRKTHWVNISEDFLGKIVQNTLASLKEKIEIKAQELSLIVQAVRLSRIETSTLKDKLHSTGIPKPIVNCQNGELWIQRDGNVVLKEHEYKSYLKTCLNVDYLPNAEPKLFMETLRGIFANFPDTEDMIRHLGEIMGYVIQPYKNIASWWLFRGPGGDGKSTILKILDGILGDAQIMSTVKLLSNGESGGYEHATSTLVSKLCVVIEEVPTGYMLKDAGLKMLSENTKMMANPKRKDQFDFMYSGTLILCSNGFPSTRDVSHAMFRRANVIPFNRQFTASQSEDINRAEKILSDRKEMSGVLNFMLAGLKRLRDRGHFSPPQSCQIAKDEWMGEANNAIRFVKENIVKTKASDIVGDLSVIYDIHYQIWCQENDIPENLRKRKNTFKQDLINLGFVVRNGGGNKLKVYGGNLMDNDDDLL